MPQTARFPPRSSPEREIGTAKDCRLTLNIEIAEHDGIALSTRYSAMLLLSSALQECANSRRVLYGGAPCVKA